MRSVEEFIELMNNLTFPNPMIRDVVVPTNQAPAGAGEDRAPRLGACRRRDTGPSREPNIALIDLRERSERQRCGIIPGSLHGPYPTLQKSILSGGLLHELGHVRVDRAGRVAKPVSSSSSQLKDGL